jgi:CNT family concentrative nucleoside transporter
MVPFKPETAESARLELTNPPANFMEAIARGTLEGISILTNILAMLVVVIALVTMANMALENLPHPNDAALTLQRLLAYAFQPVMWLIGIPARETAAAATLMGTKTVLNELVAYVDLAKLPGEALSPRSRLMMTYALCGFANFGSVGIMIGGMTAMAPERRSDIVALGMRSMVSGTMATCMSGALAGML